jgi:hypothetical protein
MKDEGGRMKQNQIMIIRQQASIFHPSSFILHP